MNGVPPETLSWVSKTLGRGTRVLKVIEMSPASHTNHRLRVDTAGGAEIDLLLRRFTDRERLASDPWYQPVPEVDALRAIAPLHVSVPALVAEDIDAAACDVPALLLTWLPGQTPVDPGDMATFVRGLAEPLPTVHAAQVPTSMRPYEPYFESDGLSVGDLRPPTWAFDRSTWERAFEAVARGRPQGPARFIHRDYHHGNTVWQEDELTGILDWTTGCVGPPGVDLARARINLAWDFDLETADAFLDAFEAVAAEPDAHHSYWDLLDAVDGLGDGTADPEDDPAALGRYEAFVARALAELG
jgi:aminoglycoside phosphotransferase (APT) family kinase protein